MKRVLITGGAGFLGSHLGERLQRDGAHVICFDNFFTGRHSHVRAAEIVRGDVCDPFHFEVDEVYHLACPASPIHYQRNPARTIRTCVQGTINALELGRNTGAKVFIASTSEVYGDPEVHPQTEEYWGNVNTLGPRSCYDEGKRAAETMALAYAQQFGVRVRVARIFNTYGPRMLENDGRVVSTMVCQALRDQPMTIFGNGEQTRSFTYVDDLIEGIVRLMAADLSPGDNPVVPVNLGNPNEFTIGQLAEMIGELVGRSSITWKPLPKDDPRRRKPDITRARRLLGWEPKVQLCEGLAKTIGYFANEIGGKTFGVPADSPARKVISMIPDDKG